MYVSEKHLQASQLQSAVPSEGSKNCHLLASQVGSHESPLFPAVEPSHQRRLYVSSVFGSFHTETLGFVRHDWADLEVKQPC